MNEYSSAVRKTLVLVTSAPWLVCRTFAVLTALLMLGGVLIGIMPASAFASTCESWAGLQPSNPSSSANFLIGVATLSSCDAWAVGSYRDGNVPQTLIEHWDGTSWSRVASPNPGGSAKPSQLSRLVATSSTNAWAVGGFSDGTADQTLIEHWNGTSWSQVASPNPGGRTHENFLDDVSATSSTNAWAVGSFFDGTAGQTLIEHWNGTSWSQVASPNPGGSAKPNSLNRVVATSSTNAWAVGSFFDGTAGQTLIEHWNGTSWSRVASPNPGGPSHDNGLAGVSAISSTDAWAVGSFFDGTAGQTLIEHWDGTSWSRVASPNPGGSSHSNALVGVAATSTTNAWAVGNFFDGTAARP